MSSQFSKLQNLLQILGFAHGFHTLMCLLNVGHVLSVSDTHSQLKMTL